MFRGRKDEGAAVETGRFFWEIWAERKRKWWGSFGWYEKIVGGDLVMEGLRVSGNCCRQ